MRPSQTLLAMANADQLPDTMADFIRKARSNASAYDTGMLLLGPSMFVAATGLAGIFTGTRMPESWTACGTGVIATAIALVMISPLGEKRVGQALDDYQELLQAIGLTAREYVRMTPEQRTARAQSRLRQLITAKDSVIQDLPIPYSAAQMSGALERHHEACVQFLHAMTAFRAWGLVDGHEAGGREQGADAAGLQGERSSQTA